MLSTLPRWSGFHLTCPMVLHSSCSGLAHGTARNPLPMPSSASQFAAPRGFSAQPTWCSSFLLHGASTNLLPSTHFQKFSCSLGCWSTLSAPYGQSPLILLTAHSCTWNRSQHTVGATSLWVGLRGDLGPLQLITEGQGGGQPPWLPKVPSPGLS